MGNISRHPVESLINKYNCYCFIETGTWRGLAIQYIKQFDFKQIFSIDISPKHYTNNLENFKSDKRIELFIGDSGIKLREVLLKVDERYNIIFWLDAHLPDLNGKQDLLEPDVIIPLERELKLIKSIRDISSDVFIIDDLRLFEYIDVPQFENCYPKDTNKDSKFIYDQLNDTHIITKDYRDQGYLVAIPRRYE